MPSQAKKDRPIRKCVRPPIIDIPISENERYRESAVREIEEECRNFPDSDADDYESVTGSSELSGYSLERRGRKRRRTSPHSRSTRGRSPVSRSKSSGGRSRSSSRARSVDSGGRSRSTGERSVGSGGSRPSVARSSSKSRREKSHSRSGSESAKERSDHSEGSPAPGNNDGIEILLLEDNQDQEHEEREHEEQRPTTLEPDVVVIGGSNDIRSSDVILLGADAPQQPHEVFRESLWSQYATAEQRTKIYVMANSSKPNVITIPQDSNKYILGGLNYRFLEPCKYAYVDTTLTKEKHGYIGPKIVLAICDDGKLDTNSMLRFAVEPWDKKKIKEWRNTQQQHFPGEEQIETHKAPGRQEHFNVITSLEFTIHNFANLVAAFPIIDENCVAILKQHDLTPDSECFSRVAFEETVGPMGSVKGSYAADVPRFVWVHMPKGRQAKLIIHFRMADSVQPEIGTSQESGAISLGLRAWENFKILAEGLLKEANEANQRAPSGKKQNKQDGTGEGGKESLEECVAHILFEALKGTEEFDSHGDEWKAACLKKILEVMPKEKIFFQVLFRPPRTPVQPYKRLEYVDLETWLHELFHLHTDSQFQTDVFAHLWELKHSTVAAQLEVERIQKEREAKKKLDEEQKKKRMEEEKEKMEQEQKRKRKEEKKERMEEEQKRKRKEKAKEKEKEKAKEKEKKKDKTKEKEKAKEKDNPEQGVTQEKEQERTKRRERDRKERRHEQDQERRHGEQRRQSERDRQEYKQYRRDQQQERGDERKDRDRIKRRKRDEEEEARREHDRKKTKHHH